MVKHEIQKSNSFSFAIDECNWHMRILFVDITEIHFCFYNQSKKCLNRGERERERERERETGRQRERKVETQSAFN